MIGWEEHLWNDLFFVVPCGIWGVMRCWLLCWFRRYIYCLLVYLASPIYFVFLYLFFLIYLLPYLPFPLTIGPPRFQAGDCKRRRNMGLSCFSLFRVIVFLCSWCIVILHLVNLVICINLGLLHIFVVVSPGFDFFSVLIKRLAGKSISEMTYFVPSRM